MAENSGGKQVLGGLMIAIIAVVLFTIVPLIGYQTEQSVDIPAASQWNSTTNTDIPTGVDLWESVGSVGQLVIVMSMLFTVIALIFVLYKKYA